MRKEQSKQVVVVVEEPVEDVARLREDEQLSEHFTLYELTVTTNAKLQTKNRTLTNAQVAKLKELAEFLEQVRSIAGRPVGVNSGFRCPELNGETAGSSSTSQHPRCEAADLTPFGMTLEEVFAALRAAARAGKFKFGQLILEQAARSYGTSKWLHVSRVGTLAPAKVGQVMEMVAGSDGVQKYTLLEVLK